MKRTIGFVLCLAVALAIIAAPVHAASEIETSAAYLVEQGIYEGDGSGNLNLDKGLTRAELAVILTRLDFADATGGLAFWRDWGVAHFSDTNDRDNKFTDLPDWALPYIEYCYEMGYVKGVTETKFDPQGKVNPKMACTVILRSCRVAETDWNYNTSVGKAQNLGIAPSDGVSGETLLRGTMAVIVCRSINYAETGAATPPSDTPAEPTTPTPSPALPDEVPAMTIDEMKAEIILLTNTERVKAGLPELKVLPELMDCAQAKAQDMYDSGRIGHISSVYGTNDEMIRTFVPGVNGGAENLTSGPISTPQVAFQAWMDSKGHRANILDRRATHIGVGVVYGENGRDYWVQQFVKLK